MHRFYCASLAPHCNKFQIDDPEEVHHITRVLRLRSGDEVELINGKGVWCRARLINNIKTCVEAELLDCIQLSAPAPVRIILACALPKRSKFDDIIEQCTELGVDEIFPLLTERTDFAPSKEALSRMGTRFNKVVRSASKQCKRVWFPVVYPVMAFGSVVDMVAKDGTTLYIPWLEGQRKLLKELLISSSPCPNQRAMVFFIGPEGDFTSNEAAYAMAKGAIPVSLGETVLRVETAATAVVAYAHFILEGRM